jgi:hypothetical protein
MLSPCTWAISVTPVNALLATWVAIVTTPAKVKVEKESSARSTRERQASGIPDVVDWRSGDHSLCGGHGVLLNFFSKFLPTPSTAAPCNASCSRGGAFTTSRTACSAFSPVPISVWGTLLMVKCDRSPLNGNNVCSSWDPTIPHDDPVVRGLCGCSVLIEPHERQ